MPATRRHNHHCSELKTPYQPVDAHTSGNLEYKFNTILEHKIETRLMNDLRRVAPYICSGLPTSDQKKSYYVIELYYKFWRRFLKTYNFIKRQRRRMPGLEILIDGDLLREHITIRRSFYNMLLACDWFHDDHRVHLEDARKKYDEGIFLHDGSRVDYGQFVVDKHHCVSCNAIDLTLVDNDDNDNIEIPANQLGDGYCFAYFFDLPFEL